MRLDKFISHVLNLTRSEAKTLLRKGEIQVNSSVVRKGDFQINPESDEITYRGGTLEYEEKVYLLLHKPKGYLSSHRGGVHPSVMNLLSGFEKHKLFIAGRLDADSEGLLLLTNDGELAHRLTSPKYRIPKKYHVQVEGVFEDSDISLFREGMDLTDGRGNSYRTLPAKLEIISKNEARITIFEGKFHQIKRMCSAAGKVVTRLVRTEIGPLKLGNLKPGSFRKLNPEEIEILRKECTYFAYP